MPVTKRFKIQLSVNQINSTSQPLRTEIYTEEECENWGQRYRNLNKIHTGVKCALGERGSTHARILQGQRFTPFPHPHPPRSTRCCDQQGSALLSNFLPLPHLQAWNEAPSSHLLQDTLSSFLTLRMRPYQYCLCFCDQGSSAILLIGSFLLRVILHGEKKATTGKKKKAILCAHRVMGKVVKYRALLDRQVIMQRCYL